MRKFNLFFFFMSSSEFFQMFLPSAKSSYSMYRDDEVFFIFICHSRFSEIRSFA